MQSPTPNSVMVAKLFPLSFIFISLFLFLFPSHAILSISPEGVRASPFEFIKDLQGSHKGEKVKGIHKLKKYLQQFGYLSYGAHSRNQTSASDDDDFDDHLESAIKAYQTNYHIKATGKLDSETVNEMMRPRCGVADIINGLNWMQSGKRRHGDGQSHGFFFHTVSHYSFFPGSPSWPNNRTNLSYKFLPGTPDAAKGPVAEAFGAWGNSTHFAFAQARDPANSHITVSFHSGDHGDGHPFDGPGGILAHAYAPTDGRFHYDADEPWSAAAIPDPDSYDLHTVALHEIGHLLGLGHSSDPQAIMFPSIDAGETKGLSEDDIQGIKDLYNRP